MKKDLFEETLIDAKLGNIRKFYFLDYFFIFLKSIHAHRDIAEAFESFRIMKDEMKLAESRFKKLIVIGSELSDVKLQRYKYTFNEVLEESLQYKLVIISEKNCFLTEKGREILSKYRSDAPDEFYHEIFVLMEQELHGFYKLVQLAYKSNDNGLLIFPMYSPPKLEMRRTDIKTNGDLVMFIKKLTKKLEDDLVHFLKIKKELGTAEANLIRRLSESNLISDDYSKLFDLTKYHAALKRIRDFWINYFLKEVYKIPLSVSYFDIWCYRGKQLGIINITEFYYNFSGRVVYPTSIISNDITSSDFKKIFTYPTTECLFVHEPKPSTNEEIFSRMVYESYIDLRMHYNSYFVNIADLRDVVCYKFKISNKSFQEHFERLYLLNLKGLTTIRISLEADRLPEESKAMYQKRDPILIDGSFKNIIAIDLKQ